MQSDIIFLEDALARAQKLGIDADHRIQLTDKLLAIADTAKEELPIPRSKAYELIEEAATQQIIDQTNEPKTAVVPSQGARPMRIFSNDDDEDVTTSQSQRNANSSTSVSRPAIKSSTQAAIKPLNLQDYFDKRSPLQADFAKAQGQLRVLDEKIERAVAAQNDSLYLRLSHEKEGIETPFIERLRKASQSPWFYTRDLLWRYMTVRHFDHLLAISSVHGPVYAALDDGTPLSTLPLKNPFVYLVSFNQVENTCGFSALANLFAVNAQVAQGKPITFSQTRELAEKAFSETITALPAFKNLERGGAVNYSADVDLIPSAARLKIDPNTIELVSHETISFLHNALKTGRKIDAIEHLKEKLHTLPFTYIIYNVGGCHWVLLAVVSKDGVPSMYLLNSSNAPVRVGDDVMKLVTYIDDLLVQRN